MANKPTNTRLCVFYNPDAEKAKDEEYGCMGEYVPGRSDSPYCPRCRANANYWTNAEKKRPGSMRRYRTKLVCRHARLDEWSGITTHAHGKNVININTARKRKHG